MNENNQTNSKGKLAKRFKDAVIVLIKANDTPAKIASGLALGIFVGWLPIMGIQMAVVSFFVLILRLVSLKVNIKAAIAGVWISNPITFIPMYYGCYRFGLVFFPGKQINSNKFAQVMNNAADWSFSNISEGMAAFINIGADILIPMWVGAIIIGVLSGLITYSVTYKAIITYRAGSAKRRELPR